MKYILLLLLLTGCSSMNSVNTNVWVIGTFHGTMKKMSNYNFQVLEKIIKDINPDVIFAEIRPDDLQRNDFSFTPLDIKEVVIPYCSQNGVAVYGIDWFPNDIREKQSEFYKKLPQTAEGKKLLESLPDELEYHKINPDRFDNT